jgi:hypothetical protein
LALGRISFEVGTRVFDDPLAIERVDERRDKVLGVTRDGVWILAPNRPATHFTAREIREAIRIVRGCGEAG